MTKRSSLTLGTVERAHRKRVLQQVLRRMGKDDLTYAKAGAILDINPATLQRAVADQATPSASLIERAEKWLAEL